MFESLIAGCISITVSNLSPEPWNDRDQEQMRFSEKRCAEIYSDAPCLKYFEKYDVLAYRATCGLKMVQIPSNE